MTPSLALIVLATAASAATAPPRESAPGWVVLPVEEYRSLRSKAFPSDPEPAPPPVDATLTRVDYDLRAGTATASGEARLAIDVFKEGWVRMPIPAGLLVKAARLDGKRVSLVGEADSASKSGAAPGILLARTGRAVLALDITVPVTSGAGQESLALPISGAAVTHASFVVPRPGVELSVSGGLLLDRTEAKSETRFAAAGRPGAALGFSWKRKKEEQRPGQPTRLRTTLTQLFGLGEEGAQASIVVKLEVTQGVAGSVSFDVPEPFVVTQVVGALVADWEAKAGKLEVRFIDPVEGETALVVVGEARTPRDGRIALPLLRVPAAEREEGGVAVEVVGAGEIRARDARGLTPADAADLGEIVAARDSPSLAAFRFRPGDGKLERSLALEVVRYTPQAVLMANVDEARYQAIVTEDGKTLVQGLYAVRNNQRSFLKVALPPHATLWSAAVARQPVRPGSAPDGALLLPLEKGRAGEEAPAFLVEIVYLERGATWTEKGTAAFRPPVLDLGISRTALQLQYSPRYRVAALPGALREAPYMPPGSPAFLNTRAPAVAQTTLEPARNADLASNMWNVTTLGAEVSGSIGGDAVRTLPLNGRNFNQLTLLMPGVASNVWQLDGAQGGLSSEELAKKREEQARQAAAEAKSLVDRFQKDVGYGARVAGTLPVQVSVPSVGPSLFLVSELTAEGTAPALQLTYKRTK
jgi:hypothetical protein